MQERIEHTPTSSPRTKKTQELRTEANGTLAPAQPGFFSENRKKLIKENVQKGLENFDAQQNQEENVDEIEEPIFRMDP